MMGCDGDVMDGLLTSIDQASQRMLQLSEMKKSVRKMNIEMSVSAAKSREELKAHFAEMKRQITEVLDYRLSKLLSEVTTIESETSTQLNSYEDEIQQNIEETKSLMDKGKSFLKNDPERVVDEISIYRSSADRKLKQKLPEPPPGEPCTKVLVDLPQILPSLLSQLSQHGDVIARIPVQITSVQQRPGGFLVTWQEMCASEDDGEMTEYKLQMSDSHQSQFSDVYQGANTQFQVRGLEVGSKYSFRVAGRSENSEKWTPCSDVQSAVVQNRHHEWSTDAPDYAVTDRNTVATRMTSASSVIHSAQPSYTCGHQMSLRVLEIGPTDTSALFGLALERNSELCREGSLCINMAGKVFVNGAEMTTKLPALVQGSCLNISSEVLSPSKVRVTLEIEEKVVTLDWKLDDDQFSFPGLEVAAEQKLYFAVSGEESGWSFRVE